MAATTTTVAESLAECIANKLTIAETGAFKGYEVPTPGGPDIIYYSDGVKYKARTERRLMEDPSLPSTLLPAGFPAAKLESPLFGIKAKGRLGNLAASLSIHIPTAQTCPVLRGLSKELCSGRGFFVLRPLPIDKYFRDQTATVHASISSSIGNLRAIQNPSFSVLAHIQDLREAHSASAIPSPAYTTDKHVFYTDIGDIISLLALETAAEGGNSRIAST
ncbi:hypothetical protein DL96DRAFT_1734955 [Flagelloscypha sp. PMI_526]|nr:hypothetical protein DL96DRAFT_1734955 [Flagelloscypha sp. PMI_526]